MAEVKTCVCGARASIKITFCEVAIEGKTRKDDKYFDMLCPSCFRRVFKLWKRLDFIGIHYIAIYDPEKDLFTIYSGNELGDTASMKETDRKPMKIVRDLFTGETTVMRGDKILFSF